MQLLSLPLNIHLIAFVFFATLCSYNFHYLLGHFSSVKNFSFQLLFNRYTALLVFVTGVVGILVVFSAAHILFQNVVVAFLLTFFYSLPLLPFKQLSFIRKAGFLKTILLSFTWMFVTAYIPLSQNGISFTTAGILLMTKRFLFMLILCIMFDNRDVGVDKIHGLHSLSTDLPVGVMDALIFVILSLLFVINFFLGRYGVTQKHVIALQVAAIFTVVIYIMSRKKQGYFFYYFIVDGMMAFTTLLTTIASI